MSNKAERQEFVKTLTKDLEGVDALILTEYKGLKVQELDELRAKLRHIKGEYRIVKNTLTKIALKNMGLEEFAGFFEGPSALVIERGDPAAIAKVLVGFAKEHENLKLRAGILEGRILSDKEIVELAKLPGRTALICKFIGTLQAPLYNLAYVLSAPLNSLVRAFQAVVDKKGKEK